MCQMSPHTKELRCELQHAYVTFHCHGVGGLNLFLLLFLARALNLLVQLLRIFCVHFVLIILKTQRHVFIVYERKIEAFSFVLVCNAYFRTGVGGLSTEIHITQPTDFNA